MSKTKQFCSVFGCRGSKKKDPTISFHSFPRPNARKVKVQKSGEMEEMDTYSAWSFVLKMDKKITKNTKVCSRHFSKECYILPDIATKRRSLKKTAVPDQNLPTTSILEKKLKSPKVIKHTIEMTDTDLEAADCLLEMYRNSRKRKKLED